LERMKLDIGLQLERKESYDCWSQQQTCSSRFCCCRRPMLGQTDRETDGRTPYRFIDPATHAGSASNTTQHVSHCSNTAQTNIRDSISPHRPGDGETICPADGSSTVAKIAADLRPSADESAVRTSAVAKLQVASVPIA